MINEYPRPMDALGYPMYSINKSGEIFNDKTGKMLFGSRVPSGRRFGLIRSDGYVKHELLHNLMAQMFFGRNVLDSYKVCHRDGDRQNNDLSNLTLELKLDWRRELGYEDE